MPPVSAFTAEESMEFVPKPVAAVADQYRREDKYSDRVNDRAPVPARPRRPRSTFGSVVMA